MPGNAQALLAAYLKAHRFRVELSKVNAREGIKRAPPFWIHKVHVLGEFTPTKDRKVQQAVKFLQVNRPDLRMYIDRSQGIVNIERADERRHER